LSIILKKKQTFVDLGCGNGFLVYLLNQEGHQGIGIDLKSRTLWKKLSNTSLQVKEFYPNKEVFSNEFDWLIGNHCDELTPWIPYIASKSNLNMNFFLLPCCFWDFDRKFSQSDQRIGKYRTYLNYIKQIINICGYEPEEETLRIPSTKNISLIGRRRNFDINNETEISKITQQRENLLSSFTQFILRDPQTGH